MPGLDLDPAAIAAPDPEALFAPFAVHRTIGLAVSGGADSLALMLLANRYAANVENPPRFIVYSVDHCLRPEAADEVAFVIGEAERLGFAARGLRWDGPKPRTRVQEAARAARYGLIARAMAADGADVLFTGHHIADQAETVLMRLAHGSGPEGLRGMDRSAWVGGLNIVRPLLRVDPAALRAVVAAAGLIPIADPGNSDRAYERVRWRQIALELAGLGLDARRLARFADRMGDIEVALARMTHEALADVRVEGSGLCLERALLQRLPRAIAVRVMQKSLRGVGGGRKPHALAAIEVLTDRLIDGPLRTTLHGCIIAGDGRFVRIEREPRTGARARDGARRNVTPH